MIPKKHRVSGLLYRVCVYIAGYLVLSLGQKLFVLAGFGAASLDAVCVGTARLTGLTAGTWVTISGVLLILISAVLRKTPPNFLAMVSSFTFGLFFDLWGLLLNSFFTDLSFLPRIVIYSAAIVLAPLGTAIYFISGFSKSAVDDFVMAVKERFHLSIGKAKTASEVLFCLSALCVSGPVGVTTLVTAFLFGPILQVFYSKITIPYSCKPERRKEVPS